MSLNRSGHYRIATFTKLSCYVRMNMYGLHFHFKLLWDSEPFISPNISICGPGFLDGKFRLFPLFKDPCQIFALHIVLPRFRTPGLTNQFLSLSHLASHKLINNIIKQTLQDNRTNNYQTNWTPFNIKS